MDFWQDICNPRLPQTCWVALFPALHPNGVGKHFFSPCPRCHIQCRGGCPQPGQRYTELHCLWWSLATASGGWLGNYERQVCVCIISPKYSPNIYFGDPDMFSMCLIMYLLDQVINLCIYQWFFSSILPLNSWRHLEFRAVCVRF